MADGVPSNNLVGLDLEPRFLDLGYELFADHESFKGRMIASDFFDDSIGNPIESLKDTIDIIHAASFFDVLVGWEGQVDAGVRMVQNLLKKSEGVLVLGRALGAYVGEERASSIRPDLKMYFHSPESFRQLWDEIEHRTGTRWTVNAWLEEKPSISTTKEKEQWLENRIVSIYFEVRRIRS